MKNASNNDKNTAHRNDKSHIKCYNCGEMGHYQSKYPKAKSKKGSVQTTEKENDTVLMTIGRLKEIKSDTWIADLAASTHIVNSNIGLYDYTVMQEPVKIGDGKLVYATKVGKHNVFYEKEDSKHVKFTLENVQ